MILIQLELCLTYYVKARKFNIDDRTVKKYLNIKEPPIHANINREYGGKLNKYKIIIEMNNKGYSWRIIWIKNTREYKIAEINSFLNGIERDLDAVKNGVKYEYNNGLAEGSVNKIKLIKRVMYGRCSFNLLKQKVLL